MNPVYSIMESPHRWLILAGIAFLAACFGAIEMLALVWPHTLARIWFYALLAATVYCLIRALTDWKVNVEAEIEQAERAQARRPEAR